MLEPEQDLRIAAIEDRLACLERSGQQRGAELGANSRASLTFIGGLLVMLLLGSRFTDGTYSYQIDLQHLTTLVGLPAIASIIAALIPSRR